MTSVQLRHIRIMAFIFSSAILGVVAVVGVQNSVTFCNTSVITEDVYLKLGACVLYPNSNPYYQGRQFKMHFLFSESYPFFDLDFLSSIKPPTAERWHPHAVLLFHFCGICRRQCHYEFNTVF